MKMKKSSSVISKILALCLAMVLSLAMGITAMAAPEGGLTGSETADVTVDGLDTENEVTVEAYQIITVNIDLESGQPKNPMYTWNSEVVKWLKDNGYGNYIGSGNAVQDAFGDMSADNQKEFLEKLANGIKTGTCDLDATDTMKSNSGSVTFENMSMGEYLLIASGGVKIYQPTTVKLVPEYKDGSWKVGTPVVGTDSVMKSTEPTISKEVVDKDDETVAVGDEVTFRLKVIVPDYPEDATYRKFVVSDKLGTGFDYSGDETIKVFRDEAGQQVIGNENYTIAETPEKERTFQINFEDAFITENAGQTIYITYRAVVNDEAFTVDELKNDAFLGYNNDPYVGSDYETDTTKKVYTYGIEVKKVDKNGGILSGAVFTLKKGNSLLKFDGVDGVYTHNSEGTSSEVEVGANGVLKLQGLDVGTYILEEVKAPDGYVLPTGKITIVIEDKEPDGTIDGGDGVVTSDGTIKLKEKATVNTKVISLIVENTSAEDAGFTLPTTGGMGTTIFTIVGILLMGGAAAMVVVISRRKKHGYK